MPEHGRECTCHICDSFRKIFRMYPNHLQYLQSTRSPGPTYKAWCNLLAECVEEDVRRAADDITGGRLWVDKGWELPQRLFERAKDYEGKRLNEEYVEQKHLAATRKQIAGEVIRSHEGQLAIRLGTMVRDGLITVEQNDACWDSIEPPRINASKAKELLESIGK